MSSHGFQVLDFARRFPTVQERCYATGKLATDPLYPAVHAALRDTTEPLLDVGCGMGVLAFYLRRRGWLPAVTGVDFDGRKIATANQLAAEFGSGLTFFQADVGISLPAHRGSVTVLDILQYFPVTAREVLLRQCAARVTDAGVLVIRTGVADDSLRFLLTHWADRLAAWANWMKAAPIHYPRQQELTEILGAEGLRGTFVPLWGRTPFNNWLGVFRREPGIR